MRARLLRRRGAPIVQPYRDLLRLLRKDVVLAESASWLFRVAPYVIFAATWVATALVPTFATGLPFNWAVDLIAIIALLGSARFFLALAGMDVGTSFGGIGSSREMMIASLAEPAMLLVVFTLALFAGTTQLSSIADFVLTHEAGLRVSLGLSLVALIMVALAENARVPVDNPTTHLELTMVHEAMVLEYSGRHLAMIEAASALKLAMYLSLIACVYLPFGLAQGTAAGVPALLLGLLAYLAKLAVLGTALAALRGQHRQDAGLPRRRVPGRCPDARLPRRAPALRLAGDVMVRGLAFDIAHLLAGGMVVVSFMLLYQDRMLALLHVFALHAGVLAVSVAWQAWIQDAPHLFVTAAIALLFKAVLIPVVLRRMVARLGIHREIEQVVGVGPTMLAGLGLTALAILVTMPVTAGADVLAREDIAFALAVVLLGLLMMITRRNAVSQVVGFMSLENGLILAATGAKGMPLVVELSVAFSVLIAFIVFGIFIFRIRERFDTVDVGALDRFRGDQVHG